MKSIEIFGPSGVGKTYIKSIVLDCCNSNKFLLDDSIVMSRYYNTKIMNGYMSYLRWIVYRLLKHPQRHITRNLSRGFVIQNQDFVNFIFDLLKHRSDDIYNFDTRIMLASYFMDSFEKIVSVYKYNSEKVCLIDEGIIQRILSVYSNSITDEEVNKYISLAYLNGKYKPLFAIQCVSTTDLIIKNINTRNTSEISGSHLGMDTGDIERYTEKINSFSFRVSKLLIANNIPTIQVDVTKSAEEISSNEKK